MPPSKLHLLPLQDTPLAAPARSTQQRCPHTRPWPGSAHLPHLRGQAPSQTRLPTASCACVCTCCSAGVGSMTEAVQCRVRVCGSTVYTCSAGVQAHVLCSRGAAHIVQAHLMCSRGAARIVQAHVLCRRTCCAGARVVQQGSSTCCAARVVQQGRSSCCAARFVQQGSGTCCSARVVQAHMLCSRGAARVVQQGWGHDRGSAVQVGVCGIIV